MIGLYMVILVGCVLHAGALPVDTSKTIERLAFGSCNKHDEAAPFWPMLTEPSALTPHLAPPDLFVWLGDIVYADKKVIWKWRIPANASQVRQLLELQKQRDGYAQFAAKVPITGIYDDHDLGMNDADKTFDEATRLGVQQALLDFLDEPNTAASIRRTRNGVYVHYVLGQAPRRVRLILLDNRSFRDPYDSETQQDMLGTEQWEWLEEVLSSTTAEITVIGSGLQVLSRGDPWVAESWSKLPQSQAKLIALLAKTNTTGALIISGDMHISEVHRLTCGGLGYPLWDFTASGMTHSWGGYIVGPLWRQIVVSNTRVPGQLYQERHWADLQFQWAEKTVCNADNTECTEVNDPENTRIKFQTYAVEDGRPVLRQSFSLASLSYNFHAGLEAATDICQGVDGDSVVQDDPWTSPTELNESQLRAAACSRHNNTRVEGTWGYPLLMNGVPVSAANAARMSMWDAIVECANAPLNTGFTPACAAVMASCYPKMTIRDSWDYYVGHAVVLGIVWGVIGTALLFAYKNLTGAIVLPGGKLIWQPISVGIVAGIIALIRALI